MIWSSYLASARTIISLVVSWFFFGFSLVFYTEHIYKEQRKGILIKSILQANTQNIT